MSEAPLEPDAPRLRNFALLVLFSLVFLTVGWSIYWYVARRIAASELESALARESAQGRTWSCASLRTSGYPLAIEFTCDRLAVVAKTQGADFVAHAHQAIVRTLIYSPRRVAIDLRAPGDVSIENMPLKFDLDWRTLQFSTRGLPDRFDRLSVSGTDVEVRPDHGLAPASIRALQMNFRHPWGVLDAPLNYEISIAGVRSPLFDATIGGVEPAVIATIGSITEIDKAAGATSPEMMDSWRTAGGRVAVTQFSFVKGDFAAQMEGLLGLDQMHRLDGKLDVRLHDAKAPFVNLAAKLGLGGALLPLLAGSIFGDQNRETHVTASFADGRLGVGPLKGILPLPPLY
ncbi:MAG: DUF2125 domain-containing protein [Hyphomicrobiales bacterium]|nr:DUF2125 domain-containing protein [Hyphomicrobiales bacterium]